MEYFNTDTPITVADVTLIPVVRICLHASQNKIACWLSGEKQVLAIIVCDAHGVRAFDMCSSEISVAPLLKSIPGLDAILTPYRQHNIAG